MPPRLSETFLDILMGRKAIPYNCGKKLVILKPEEKICVRFADILRKMTIAEMFPYVWFHCPNESKRNWLVALIVRAMGLISGVSDYVFLCGSGSFAIEMKSEKGVISPNQKCFALWCAKNGVKHAYCYSVKEAITTLISWGMITINYEETINRFDSIYEID